MNTPPDPVVRVAGVPRRTLTVLNTPKSLELAENILDTRDRIAEEGRRIADALHPVIGHLPDPALKPRVVGLRRAAHQGRPPRAAEWDPAVRAALPDPLADRIRRWLERRTRCAEHLDTLAAVFQEETHDALAAFRDALAQPRFRQGLLHAGPALDDVLERWLADPAGPPPGTKALVSLARYLTRAAVKTSPHGTFTATGRARWTEHGPWLSTGDLESRSTTAELNLARLRRIADGLLRTHPALRDALRLRRNPTLTVADGTLRLIAPGPGARITAFPAGDRAPDLLGALEKPAGATPADAGPAVRRFVSAGMLQEDLPLDDQEPCHLDALIAWLTDHAHLVPADTRHALTALRSALPPAPRPAHHADRRRRARAARDRLLAVERALRLPAPREPYERRPVHEDSVLDGTVATLARAPWQPLLADLASVGRALAVLDRDLPARYAAAAWLADRYGPRPRIPLLLALHGLREDPSPAAEHVRALLRPGFGVDDTLLRASPLPAVRRLADHRAATLRALRDGTLPTEAAAPRPPLSLAHYIQPLPGPDGLPRAVLNAVTVGHGHWRGRLDRMRARATGGPGGPGGPGGSVPPPPAARTGPGRIPVDIGGLYASNTNLRHPTLPHAFDHPFTRGAPSGPGRIPLGEVTVHLDPATGLPALRSPRHGHADLIPVHLGLMSPLLLPPPLATLLRLFGDPHTLFRTGHPLLPGPFTEDVPDRGFVSLPRLQAGRVVLRRRTWLTRAAAVPRRAPGKPDYEHFLRLQAWRRELGLPTTCFIRTRTPRGEAPDAFADKGYKPVYLDFASPLLIRALTRSLDDPDTVVHIEEALPEPSAHHGHAPDGHAHHGHAPDDTPYTSEFVIELPGDFHAPAV
ncbi:lantibiotic dehydratase [Streptomyces sparsogenes]|uniref:Lantibiotic dehydratase domain protein n=1 Tax=Streptomyces sparsogenes DSM 40356 TaxID=1331668 RepID=A0A1R1S9Z6_9ACTN|nr:lantibiotic dehydratase [Streptomyces sparsogenes]OMI35125.1 Lantibiotic dehydratase domain protein [Streptomyces sparsogenes DSM 40356]